MSEVRDDAGPQGGCMSSMLWKMYYDMFWEFYPDKSRHSEQDSAEAQSWADYLMRYNRTPGHYDQSVYHQGGRVQ